MSRVWPPPASPEHEDREALAYRLSPVGSQAGTGGRGGFRAEHPGDPAVSSPELRRRPGPAPRSTSGRFAPKAAVCGDRRHRGDTRRGKPVSGGLPIAGRTGPNRTDGDPVKPGQQPPKWICSSPDCVGPSRRNPRLAGRPRGPRPWRATSRSVLRKRPKSVSLPEFAARKTAKP